jgi:hypothetical protein
MGTSVSDKSPSQIGLKQEDALLQLLCNFALKYAIRKDFELNRTHQFQVCANDVNTRIFGRNVNIIKENTDILSQASGEVGLEVNKEKTKYMVVLPPKCRTKSTFTNCQ